MPNGIDDTVRRYALQHGGMLLILRGRSEPALA
jgi:hypothetical protein